MRFPRIFLPWWLRTIYNHPMTYLVLARKYRPRSFDTLIGQDHVVRALTHALDTQRLHHAWLFTGTRGVGKTTLSRILAKSLNCETGITSRPCGVCQACRDIDAGRFVDYVELDAASNRGVDEMTQLLEQAVYAPSVGRFKVYMIDEVHMLTGHAFNAMLKTLEEPPAHVKFIIATTDPQKIPVTVLSRCLQFNLKQMPPDAIVGHLTQVLAEEQIPAEAAALRLIAQAAGGSMRDALSLTDQAIAYSAGQVTDEAVRGMLGTIDQRHLVRLLQALGQGQAATVIDVADELAMRGLSYSGALADLSSLLSRVAIARRVPGALDAADPLAADIVMLAAELHPDTVQLFYTVAVHSRQELALAPDEYAGFVMACLRMLALISDAGPVDMLAPVDVAARRDASSQPSTPVTATSAASATNKVNTANASNTLNASNTSNTLNASNASNTSNTLNAANAANAANASNASNASNAANAPADAAHVQSRALSADAAVQRDSTVRLEQAAVSAASPLQAGATPSAAAPVAAASPDAACSAATPSAATSSATALSAAMPPAAEPSKAAPSAPAAPAASSAKPARVGDRAQPPVHEQVVAAPMSPPPWDVAPDASPASAGDGGLPATRDAATSASAFSGPAIGTPAAMTAVSAASAPPVAAIASHEPPSWVSESIPDDAAGGADFGFMGGADDDDEFETLSDEPFDALAAAGPPLAPVLKPAPKAGRAGKRARLPQLSDMTADQWPALAAALPVTGLAAEVARQSEWLGASDDTIRLRVAVRTLADSASRIRLQTVLCEHYRRAVRIDIVVGATGEATAHAVGQSVRIANQQAAEEAVAQDAFVNALVSDFGAQIVPQSIRHVAALAGA